MRLSSVRSQRSSRPATSSRGSSVMAATSRCGSDAGSARIATRGSRAGACGSVAGAAASLMWARGEGRLDCSCCSAASSAASSSAGGGTTLSGQAPREATPTTSTSDGSSKSSPSPGRIWVATAPSSSAPWAPIASAASAAGRSTRSGTGRLGWAGLGKGGTSCGFTGRRPARWGPGRARCPGR